MTCRDGATTTTFPTEDYFWTAPNTLHWISQAPPMFVIDGLANGFAGITVPALFMRTRRP